jgi:hypothetical protein
VEAVASHWKQQPAVSCLPGFRRSSTESEKQELNRIQSGRGRCNEPVRLIEHGSGKLKEGGHSESG